MLTPCLVPHREDFMTKRVLLVLAAGLLLGADPKDDLKKMQGEWQVAGQELGGKKATKEALEKADLRLTIDGNKFKYTAGGKEDSSGTFTVGKDNQIDVTGK